MKKKIPKFKNENEERDFWQSHDSTEYVDWKSAERLTLANLKPSIKTISLRLPESMLEELKLLANKRDVPYQSLVKVFLSDRIEQELVVKQDIISQCSESATKGPLTDLSVSFLHRKMETKNLLAIIFVSCYLNNST